MIQITTSKALRHIMDELNGKKIIKENIIAFFQNQEGNYVVMYESNNINNGAKS